MIFIIISKFLTFALLSSLIIVNISDGKLLETVSVVVGFVVAWVALMWALKPKKRKR